MARSTTVEVIVISSELRLKDAKRLMKTWYVKGRIMLFNPKKNSLHLKWHLRTTWDRAEHRKVVYSDTEDHLDDRDIDLRVIAGIMGYGPNT